MTAIYITLLSLAFFYTYWILPRKFRIWLLLFANAATLIWLGWFTFATYLFSATLVFICSQIVSRLDPKLHRAQRRFLLAFATMSLLAPLVYFRIPASDGQFATRPMALSYFTLMLLAYFFEVHRGSIRPNRFDLEFFGFSSFFPISTMGPIERYSHLAPQMREPRNWNSDRACEGIFLIALGAFKKSVIADRLAGLIADPNFRFLSYSGIELWIFCIFAFIQIFCDFSGWIDIARGFSKLLGFDIVDNFNQPYLARSIPDIWRRWHISLVDWLRDFVYTPIALRTQNLHLATFAVMLLVGLWHGFTWNALLWACYWSSLYSAAIIIRRRGWKIPLPSLVKVVFVFLLMSLSTIILLPRTFVEFLELPLRLTSWGGASHGILNGSHITKLDSLTAAIGFAFVICFETLQRSTKSKAIYLLLAAFVFWATMIFATSASRTFIYLKY